jgi:hypothetical protein
VPEPNLVPSGLRLADSESIGEQDCGACLYFEKTKGVYGACKAFSDYPVKAEWVCDSYSRPDALDR